MQLGCHFECCLCAAKGIRSIDVHHSSKFRSISPACSIWGSVIRRNEFSCWRSSWSARAVCWTLASEDCRRAWDSFPSPFCFSCESVKQVVKCFGFGRLHLVLLILWWGLAPRCFGAFLRCVAALDVNAESNSEYKCFFITVEHWCQFLLFFRCLNVFRCPWGAQKPSCIICCECAGSCSAQSSTVSRRRQTSDDQT